MDQVSKDMQKTLHVAIDASSAPDAIDNERNNDNQSVDATDDGIVRSKLPIDTLSRLLSERNITLLKMIKSAQPKSVAELARLSGRPKASLTLTLRRLEQFGIVAFKPSSGRRKIPIVSCDRLMLEVAIND